MTIDRDLRPLLNDWMQEDAILPDDLDEVLGQLPKTPQKRHRWSFSLPKITWRNDTMFSAVRIVAAVAVLALTGSFALVVSPVGDPIETAPSTTAEEGSLPLRFDGSMLWGIEGESFGEQDGDIVRGRVGATWGLDHPDPRLNGRGLFIHDTVEDGWIGPVWGTYRMETDVGAWEGTMSGFSDQHEIRYSGWLRGEGDYAGLSQYLEIDIDTGAMADVVGVIVAGDPPSDPPTFD